jgi:hypothetical protein
VWWPSQLARERRPGEDLTGELETVGSAAE